MLGTPDFLSLPIFASNSLLDWAIAFGVMLLTVSVLLTARRIARVHLKKLQATEKTEFLELPLEVLSRTTLLFFIVLAIYLGLNTLTMSDRTAQMLDSVITIAVFWQAGVWVSAATLRWLERKRRLSLATDRATAGTLGIVGFIARMVIWTMVLLLTLENLGVDITALVAGLGIGGIAIALAVQNILGDLFASLSITLDRPFVIGDFLIVDDFLGSVENIGIKSTRLRSLSGEQIIMSNADLLTSRVRNYGRMAERRVVFTLHISYQTPIEELERIPQMIRKIIEAQESTRFDRSHFAKHSPYSLEFETVYYVLSPDYNRYMDIQQAINLRIHREFAARGINFAYPTQKLFITRTGSKAHDSQSEELPYMAMP